MELEPNPNQTRCQKVKYHRQYTQNLKMNQIKKQGCLTICEQNSFDQWHCRFSTMRGRTATTGIGEFLYCT